MYKLTINGKPFGKPMSRLEAERKLNSMKFSILGLQMRRMRLS